MKRNLRQISADQIRFYHTFKKCPDGGHRVLQVGVGPGPSLWVKLQDLSVSRGFLARLDDSLGPVTFDHCGHTYVNMRAFAETCPDEDLVRAFHANTDALLDILHPNNFRNPTTN